MSAIQLEGTVSLGESPTDFSDEISSLVINVQRDTVETPATFANAETDVKAGAQRVTVTINFLGDPKDADGVIEELYTAIQTGSAELDFTGVLGAGLVSATNPEWSGTLIVTDLDIGGTVGEEYSQSKTYPVKAGTLSRSTGA